MIQSNIIITKTYVEQQAVQKLVTRQFFITNSFDFKNLANEEVGFNSNVIVPEFKSKDEFRKAWGQLYGKHVTPTLCFLGDLENYSVPLQEGLLKLLEEPPENLYIVMFAHRAMDLLPTIVSRSNVVYLPDNIILKNLDKELLESTAKVLPDIRGFVTELLNGNEQDILKIDFKKVERENINMWLWQMEYYLSRLSEKSADKRIGVLLSKVLKAAEMNHSNVQKKFVIQWLNL